MDLKANELWELSGYRNLLEQPFLTSSDSSERELAPVLYKEASILITSLVDAQNVRLLGDPEDTSVLGDGGEEDDAFLQVGWSGPGHNDLVNLIADLFVCDGILFGRKEKDETS